MAEATKSVDPNAEWFKEQEHANDTIEPKTVRPAKISVSTIVPPGKKLNLHKPKDIGIAPWQEREN